MFIRVVYTIYRLYGGNDFSRTVKKYLTGSDWTRFMIVSIKLY